ncbi:hypothetical protein CCP3SC1_950013 [Gammaproteobacteria bacterium]
MPEVKEQIIDMAMNGSGIRDTARVLGISPGTVISKIKETRTLYGTSQSVTTGKTEFR